MQHRFSKKKSKEKAGSGNRTRMTSLEGWDFTIKLCPLVFLCRAAAILIKKGRTRNVLDRTHPIVSLFPDGKSSP